MLVFLESSAVMRAALFNLIYEIFLKICFITYKINVQIFAHMKNIAYLCTIKIKQTTNNKIKRNEKV